jgi:hypothetical protein
VSDRNHDGWRLVGIGSEGLEVSIGGINPWAYEWQSTGETIEVPHPSYPLQRHMLEVWRTETSVPTRFAAGELSNGVWCFYEPTTDT